jgi:hypothetical protein
VGKQDGEEMIVIWLIVFQEGHSMRLNRRKLAGATFE